MTSAVEPYPHLSPASVLYCLNPICRLAWLRLRPGVRAESLAAALKAPGGAGLVQLRQNLTGRPAADVSLIITRFSEPAARSVCQPGPGRQLIMIPWPLLA